MVLGKLSCSQGGPSDRIAWNRRQACCLLPPAPCFFAFSSYFTLHSKRPQEWVSGCFSSSFTALVFTGSKFTMQATPRLHRIGIVLLELPSSCLPRPDSRASNCLAPCNRPMAGRRTNIRCWSLSPLLSGKV